MVAIINECLNGLNHLGDVFTRYAVGAFLQSAVLVIMLFGIDLLLRRRVRAVFRYCIWLLVLVKLILPPTLSLPTGIGYWVPDRVPVGFVVPEPSADVDPFAAAEAPLVLPREPSSAVAPAQPAPTAVVPDGPVTPAVVHLTPITGKAILMLFWLVGMLAFAVVLAQRMRFVRGLVAAGTAAQGQLLDLLEACRRQIGVRGRVELRISDALSSPAVCGLLRPTILMPASLVDKLSPEGLKATLVHELAHIKRADLWVNALQTLLQVVYFYNPFVWFANAMIRRTCEEAVDETVLVALGGQASDYSNTLINIGEMVFWKADFGLRLVGVAESKRALKRRIRHMLTRPIPQNARIGVLGTLAILLVAAVLLPMARGERSSEETSTASAAAKAEASETTLPAEVNDVIVDPNTGVKFVLAKTFSAANDVLPHVNKLILSPDARFLLHWGKVLPLDGTEMFRYTERGGDVREVAVSPNGRYIAHGEHAVWLQPVSPDTLRPHGPAKKLLDLRGGRLAGRWNRRKAVYWTRDSRTVFFHAYDAEASLQPYAFSAASGAPVSFPDAASTGLPSPDGKCIALTLPTDNPRGAGFWVKPIGDGAARMLCEEGPGPVCWSIDGQWLIGATYYGEARFVRYPEGQEYVVPLPKELAEDYTTLCVGSSADRSRLFFYQASAKLTHGIRVASAEDTAPRHVIDGWPETVQWTPDGKGMFHTAYTARREMGLSMTVLSGEKPAQFTLRPALPDGATPLSVSPDGKWLLSAEAQESDGITQMWSVTPLSMANREASGSTTVLFRMTRAAQGSSPFSVSSVWSPDSTRVALAGKADGVNEQDIWVAFVDGRTPIRLTQTTAIDHHLTWSPDGNMLAYLSGDAGIRELKVIPTSGGEAVTLRQWAVAAVPSWTWSPDNESLTIAEESRLVRQPLSGGKAEPIVNLKEYGIEWLAWHGWSPDGRRLAVAFYRRNSEAPLASCGQLLFGRVEGGQFEQMGATDLGPATFAGRYAWSPDGAHVAYEYEGLVAIRPEGRLYAVAVDDIVERIEAGAIPSTGPKVPEPAIPAKAPESEPTPQLEPIAASVFSDNFDKGLSECWQIVPGNPEASPPPAHAVENGQLILTNCSAHLGQVDWADYRVTIRVCVKEGGASEQGIATIQMRATPSYFDIKTMERYALLFICSNNAPACMVRLALFYHDASGASHGPTLGRTLCPLVPGKWYTLAFEVRGERLRGYLDDKLVAEATDARLSKGPVWISAAGAPVLFDDFSVRRLP